MATGHGGSGVEAEEPEASTGPLPRPELGATNLAALPCRLHPEPSTQILSATGPPPTMPSMDAANDRKSERSRPPQDCRPPSFVPCNGRCRCEDVTTAKPPRLRKAATPPRPLAQHEARTNRLGPRRHRRVEEK